MRRVSAGVMACIVGLFVWDLVFAFQPLGWAAWFRALWMSALSLLLLGQVARAWRGHGVPALRTIAGSALCAAFVSTLVSTLASLRGALSGEEMFLGGAYWTLRAGIWFATLTVAPRSREFGLVGLAVLLVACVDAQALRLLHSSALPSASARFGVVLCGIVSLVGTLCIRGVLGGQKIAPPTK